MYAIFSYVLGYTLVFPRTPFPSVPVACNCTTDSHVAYSMFPRLSSRVP
jgi:hypothetical protein